MHSRIKFFVVSLSSCIVIMLLLGAIRGRSAAPDDTYRHLGVYTEVLSRIKSDYVEEPDMKGVTLGAITGLLESIDPYASYLNADQYKQYLKAKDTKKAGVGLVLSKKFGYVGIVDSVPGSPAAKAGLTTTDMIESINGVATRDMPLAFAELLLGGEAGTTVEISVLRFRHPEPQKITLTRAAVKTPPVTAKMLPDQVGLLQLASLDGNNVSDAKVHLEELQKQGAKQIVLDLRHSSTGTPEQGAALANLFLDKGLITYSQGQKVKRQDIDADSAKAICRLPLVVITNRGTADAAEIAAAALLDDKRAEVVGERTYGDAAIRKLVTMEDGSAILLSTAKYYSPSGKAIQDTGVTPSVPLIESEQAADSEEDATPVPDQPAVRTGEDTLLKKAVEILTKGKPADTAAKSGEPAQTAAPSTQR